MNGPVLVDVEDFRRRVGSDEELIKEIFQIYIEDVDTYLSRIITAFDNEDFKDLKSTAHGLKGMSANISANVVRDAAYRLEKLAEDKASNEVGTLIEELKNNINITIEILGQYIEEGGD